jgi:uncharacterized membrane protein
MPDITVPRWVVIVATLVVLFCLTLFVVSLVVAYFGDEYVHPAYQCAARAC